MFLPMRLLFGAVIWFFACDVVLADDPFAIQWAWSEQEAKSAGDSFWPQFRGPTADGVAATNAQPPTAWGESTNLLWKLPIAGKAWSSPVAWGDKIWLTTASDDGLSMSALCVDRNTGAIRWNKEVFANAATQPDFHAFNSYGSPSPVVDANNLYVSFGAYGTAALNRENGELVWQRRDLPCNHYRGAGSSPILYRNTLIFHMDGFDFQYVVALDKKTGETVWKIDRNVDYGTEDGDIKKAFSTPLLLEVSEAGSTKKQTQMISTTSKAVLSYDPKDGRELWKARYKEFSSTARPVFDGERIFISTGFGKAKMLAIGVQGSGDVTDSKIAWEGAKTVGSKPSPLLVVDSVCSVDDRGVLSAFSRTTGAIQWQARLGGDFSASPILANGFLYCFDEKGKGHVYSPEGKEVSVNSLDDGCLASPLAIGRDLIVRTRTHLYCFRQP
jgi:outer membrane protein assembly factor BamB